jgi:hypothetical protein
MKSNIILLLLGQASAIKFIGVDMPEDNGALELSD